MKLIKQIETLVDIIGSNGAIKAIVESKKFVNEDLLTTSRYLGLSFVERTSKQTIVEQLVSFVESRGRLKNVIRDPFSETCNRFNRMSLRTYTQDLLSLTNICRVLNSIGFDDKIYINQEHTRSDFSTVPIKPYEILYEDDYISIERYYNFLSRGTPIVNVIFIKHCTGLVDSSNYFNAISGAEYFNSVNPREVILKDGTTYVTSDDISSTITRLKALVEYLESIKPIDYGLNDVVVSY